MDCGHGWHNENDCDVCRPPAIVVAGLRGRITELETALRRIAAMTKENEHDLFSATRIAAVALGEN